MKPTSAVTSDTPLSEAWRPFEPCLENVTAGHLNAVLDATSSKWVVDEVGVYPFIDVHWPREPRNA